MSDNHNRFKTHCHLGHEFTPENTRTYRVGDKTHRSCRTCSRTRARLKARSGNYKRISIARWLRILGYETLANQVAEGVHRDVKRALMMEAAE